MGEQLTLAVRSENILLDEAEMENVVEQNEAEGTGRHLHATVKVEEFLLQVGCEFCLLCLTAQNSQPAGLA